MMLGWGVGGWVGGGSRAEWFDGVVFLVLGLGGRGVVGEGGLHATSSLLHVLLSMRVPHLTKALLNQLKIIGDTQQRTVLEPTIICRLANRGVRAALSFQTFAAVALHMKLSWPLRAVVMASHSASREWFTGVAQRMKRCPSSLDLRHGTAETERQGDRSRDPEAPKTHSDLKFDSDSQREKSHL